MTNLSAVPPVCGNYGAGPAEDPSALTVKMLLRELANLKEVLVARMDGTDKIIGMLQKEHEGISSECRIAIAALKTHHEEKFSSIQVQFRERDVRTEQTSKDGKVAVDAALQAAKEAVGEQNKSSAQAIGKSETATNKQMDQIGITVQNMGANLSDKIDDVKNRLNVIDGRTKGGMETKDDHRANIAIGVSVVMAVITIGSLVYDKPQPAIQAPPQIQYLPAPQMQYTPAPTTTTTVTKP